MEGLRKRRNDSADHKSLISKYRRGVKRLDLFPKVDDDYVIKTNGGGYGRITESQLGRSFCNYHLYHDYSIPNRDFCIYACSEDRIHHCPKAYGRSFVYRL